MIISDCFIFSVDGAVQEAQLVMVPSDDVDLARKFLTQEAFLQAFPPVAVAEAEAENYEFEELPVAPAQEIMEIEESE